MPLRCGFRPVSNDAPRGIAPGGIVELREANAVRREAVDVRRANLRAVAADVGKAHVVRQDEHDIRPGRLGGEGGDAQRGTEEKPSVVINW
jgi:hypothetical protein